MNRRACRHGVASDDSPADLGRAQWLLMHAKAESADAIFHAAEARRAAAIAIGTTLLGLVGHVVVVLVHGAAL